MNNHSDEIIDHLVLTEAWQLEDRRECAQPALLGNLQESLDRAFVLGAKRALESLRAEGLVTT